MHRFSKAQVMVGMRKLVVCCLIVFATAMFLTVDNPAMGYSGGGDGIFTSMDEYGFVATKATGRGTCDKLASSLREKCVNSVWSQIQNEPECSDGEPTGTDYTIPWPESCLQDNYRGEATVYCNASASWDCYRTW